MEVMRLFQYWTLWMSKSHTVPLHHVIAVYKDMFNYMDLVIWALAQKKTQWKEDLFFGVRLARQKLSKYYAEVTSTTGMLLMSAHILDSFQMLRSFRMWDMGMDLNPEHKTFYTTQSQEAFLKYVEHEYCAKHSHRVNKLESLLSSTLVPFTMASGSCQSFFDPYYLSSNDEEYIMSKYVAEMTPGQRDCAAFLLTAARVDLNLPAEAPTNLGQIDSNLNNCHSSPTEISRTFWIPDITDRWHQQEETQLRYADLSNVAHNIVSIIPYGVGVEASFSLRRDIIGWR